MPEKARKYEAVAGFAPAGAVVSVPFVLLHRRIARGERRRPRALKKITAVRCRDRGFYA